MPSAEEIAEAVWKTDMFTLNKNQAKAMASRDEGERVSAGAILQRLMVLGDRSTSFAKEASEIQLDARELADLIPDSIAKDVADILAERLRS